MAHPWTINYDPALTEVERIALKHADNAFSIAFAASHYWSVALDSKQRRYLRAVNYADRNQCLGQFILSDITTASDAQDLKSRIIAGDFPCSELP